MNDAMNPGSQVTESKAHGMGPALSLPINKNSSMHTDIGLASLFHLNELLFSPPCSCLDSCLRLLMNNWIGQAALTILEADFRRLTSKTEQRNFFSSYVQDADCKYPYIFKPDDKTDQTTIPLCFIATAAVFGLYKRGQQETLLASPQGRKELKRQSIDSQLICAIAMYLKNGSPIGKKTGWELLKIEWNNSVFSEICSMLKVGQLQRKMKSLGLNPWNGCLLYAVKGHQRFTTLLSELRGCYFSLSDPHIHMLSYLGHLAPTSLVSSKWKKVHSHSIQNSQQRNKYSVHYMTLNGNTLLGQCMKHVKGNAQFLEPLIQEFTESCQSIISSVAGGNMQLDEMFTSILRSPFHALQNPHYDFNSRDLDSYGQNMYLGFTPLTSDGMFLQVWKGEGVGNVLYIPHGQLVILPSLTMHAGGFCSSARSGNLRLHFYFYLNGVKGLLTNTNVYSDENGHFSTRYLNATGLSEDGALTKLFAKH